MTQTQKDKIVKISKEFTKGLDMGPINESSWLIVDPLSGYLNAIGYENKLGQLPESDKHPQILVMTFADGSRLIPAGGDLKRLFPDAKNWLWL